MAIAVNLGFTGQATSDSAMRFSMLIYAMIILATTLILYSLSYGTVLPLLKTLVLIFEPQLWRGAMQFFTQPILFLLVHLVVLSIWASSGVACYAVTDVIKEEIFQSVGTDSKINCPRVSSPHKQNITTDSPGCGLQGNSADSKVLSFSANAHPTQRQDCVLDRRNRTTRRRTKFEKKSASFPSRVIVRDLSTGEANSDESGVSCCRQEVLVMEKDELNERIEAFFARFREQLRQECLNNQQQQYMCMSNGFLLW
ncbi:hypothetical protein O6H91_08G083700 [Diphasiastrum complanatum]|nr:hypothetical protein O6H91_08G083700 [Diphasiastrum complanatum]